MARQRAYANRRTHMPASIAEHRDQQVGGSVDHRRRIGKSGRGVHIAVDREHFDDAIE